LAHLVIQRASFYYEILMQTSKTFSLKIEQIALEKNITHMDAVLWYCSKNEIDPSTVARLINKALKEKIEVNAADLNFLPKQAKLPI